MTATIRTQNTGLIPAITGALTAPVTVLRTVGARHRAAVADHAALPGWALAATTGIVLTLIVFAVIAWRDVASPLLIACATIAAAAAFTPDVIAALETRQDAR